MRPAGAHARRSGYRQERCLPQTQRGAERGLHRWWGRQCCSSRETPPPRAQCTRFTPGVGPAEMDADTELRSSPRAGPTAGPSQVSCGGVLLSRKPLGREGRAHVSTTVQLARAERGPETRESLCARPSWTDGEGAGERTLGGPGVVAVLCHLTSWP